MMFHHKNLFKEKLQQVSAHGGKGKILTSRVLELKDVQSACNFVDFTILPPNTTIGLHTHQSNEEEFYLVLYGVGIMESDSKILKVEAGSLIRNRPGGSHSLDNTGDGPLGLFVFELQTVQKT